jgi:hypothetical protein
MSIPTPHPVVSGTPYVVREVRGRSPERLSDFAGQTTFVLRHEGQEDYVVCGAGVDGEDEVRVFEKDGHGYGKDVRVWSVRRQAGTDSFTAEHCVGLFGL